MSYKYLYGFTNEASYDFSKAIYFGKQDRNSDSLVRIPEHYRVKDSNHEQLKAAKYVIFTRVDLDADLSDLEAYFIQTYKPELNTVYNEENNSNVKLNNTEWEHVKTFAEKLEWYLTWNDYSYLKDLTQTINRIQEKNKIIEDATYVFNSKEELLDMPCKEAVAIIKNNEAAIMPEVKNTLLYSPYYVAADEENVYVDSSKRSIYWHGRDQCSLTLPYQKILTPHYIPEIKLSTLQIVTATKEHFSDEFTLLDTEEEFRNNLLELWFTLLYYLSKELVEKEPSFTKDFTFEIITQGLDYFANYNGGFNSTNWNTIRLISDLFYSHQYERTIPIWQFEHLYNYAEIIEKYKTNKLTEYIANNSDYFVNNREEEYLDASFTVEEWFQQNCN